MRCLLETTFFFLAFSFSPAVLASSTQLDIFFEQNSSINYEDSQFQVFLDSLLATSNQDSFPYKSERRAGNHVELLDTAESSYEKWSQLLEGAKNHIHIQTFFFEDDVFAGTLAKIACPGAPKILENNSLTCKIWQAANRQVHVRLIADSFGNLNLINGGERLVSALASHPNIDVQNFNPLQAYTGARNLLWKEHKVWLWSQNRIHTKMLIVDGTRAIQGGRNIGANYTKADPKSPPLGWARRNYGVEGDKKYRDTDVYIEGPGVASLQKSFLASWMDYASWERTVSKLARNWSIYNPKTWLRRANCLQISYYNLPYYCLEDDTRLSKLTSIEELLDDEEFFPELSSRGDSFYRYVESNPFRFGQIPDNPYRRESTPKGIIRGLSGLLPLPQAPKEARGISKGELAYLALIKNAKKSIYLTNPYFVLNDRLEAALIEAITERGIELKIFTNSIISANPLELWDCSAKSFSRFLELEARIFEFQGDTGMMHAKTAIFDDKIAVVGSFNFDEVSYSANAEGLSILEGEALLQSLQNSFDEDLSDAIEMTPSSLERDARLRGLDSSFEKALCRELGPVI